MLPTQIGLDWIPWVDVANRVQRTGGERQCTTKFPIAILLFLKLQPLNGVNYFKHTIKNDLFLKLNCSVANHVFSPEVTTREDFDCVCLGVYLAVHTGLLQDHQFSVQTSSASCCACATFVGEGENGFIWYKGENEDHCYIVSLSQHHLPSVQ